MLSDVGRGLVMARPIVQRVNKIPKLEEREVLDRIGLRATQDEKEERDSY